MESSEYFFEEPVMSDKTLMLDVEDLIGLTFGPLETNVVNFGMMQTVINILARHMRLLEKEVEIRFTEDEQQIKILRKQLKEEALGYVDSGDESDVEKLLIISDTFDDSTYSDQSEVYMTKSLEKSDRKKGWRTKIAESVDDIPSSDEEVDSKRTNVIKTATKERARSKLREISSDMPVIDKSEDGNQDTYKKSKDSGQGKSRKGELAGKLQRLVKSAHSDVKLDKKGGRNKQGKSKTDESSDEFLRDKDDSSSKRAGKSKMEKGGTSSSKSSKSKSSKSNESEKLEKAASKRGEKQMKSKKGDMPDDSHKLEAVEEGDEKKTKKGKLKRKTATDSPISDSSDDVSVRSSKKREIKMQSKRPKTAAESLTSVRSDVNERIDKRTKDKMDTQTKKGTFSDDTPTAKTSETVVGKKKLKPKISKVAGDTLASDETERGAKRKGKKDKDKMAESIREKEGVVGSQSKGGIIISEVVRKGGKGIKDTILVVEKGPTTRDSHPRLGGIEVVTRPQFELLKTDVQQLLKKEVPKPVPTVQADKKLKDDLARGSATLSGAVEAMKLNERIKAAEEGLSRMAVILDRLAADGTLPPETSDVIKKMQIEQRQLSRILSEKVIPAPAKKIATKSAASAPSTPRSIPVKETPKPMPKKTGKVEQVASIVSLGMSKEISSILPPKNPLVTRSDLSAALENVKDAILATMTTATAKSTASAEQAQKMAQSVATKLDIALGVKARIDLLDRFTNKQTEQLSGFDTGLNIQLQKFQSQLRSMRKELKEGLEHLDRGDKHESSVVTSLKDNYEMIELKMDHANHVHAELIVMQKHISEDLHNVTECVDLLRTEKVNRQEVLNGLKDKVSVNRLRGLLREEVFEVSHEKLTKDVDKCFGTFEMKNSGWMRLLGKLAAEAKKKADLVNVYSLRTFTTDRLNYMDDVLRKLEIILGDPELAQRARAVSRGAQCGACLTPAQMDPFEKSYSKPPAMRALPVQDTLVTPEEEISILHPPDNRKHICKRWVGGSHTLITQQHKIPEKLPQSELQPTPVKHYVGTGVNGHMYMMEETLQACVECNKVSKVKPEDKSAQQPQLVEVGGGDRGGD